MIQRFFNRYKIRTKLYIIGGGIAVFFIIVGSLNYYYINKLRRYSDVVAKVEKLSYTITKLRKAEKDFLLIDRFSSDFLLSNKSKSLNNFEYEFAEAKTLFDQLEKNPLIQSNQLVEQLGTIRADFESYYAIFHQMVKAINERGYDNTGLVGRMETAANEFQLKVEQLTNNNDYNKKVVNIRLTEKNYLLKKELQYKDKLLTQLRTFHKELKNRTINPVDTSIVIQYTIDSKDANQIIAALEQYRDLFTRLSEADNQIGLTGSKGLVSNAVNLIHQIETKIKTINNKVREQNEKARKNAVITLIIILLLLLLISFFKLITIANGIAKPLEAFRDYIMQLGKGELPGTFKVDTEDEIAEMATAVNALTTNLKNTRQFVEEVGQGNLDTEVNVFDNKGELGEALVQMRSELQKIANERQKQEQDDDKRNWTTQGIARFNDVLRKNTENLQELGYQVIKELIDYLQAVQGALFVIKETESNENTILELIAAHAYNRRKYQSKQIAIGEGLAGRCAREQKTIYLTDIPDGHYEITSGLGKSDPRSLLIAPIILNDNLFGVIEIASYNKLKDYEIAFTEKIAESVAANISNVKISERTSNLLAETQKQADELAAKEEQMRQNMEELKTTQDEAARKEAIATGFVNSVNHSIIRADYLLDGTLEYANLKFLDLMGYKLQEAKGMKVTSFVNEKDMKLFEIQWKRVVRGGKHIEQEMRYYTKEGKHWFLATYTPIRNLEGEVVKILYLAIDIEHQKNKNLDYENEIKAIRRSIIQVEFKTDGTMIDANEQFCKALGYSKPDLKNLSVFSYIPNEKTLEFENTWKSITRGNPYEEQREVVTKSGKTKWFQGSYTAVKDFDDLFYKVIYIAYDVSDQKQLELEAAKKADILMQQDAKMRENMEEMQNVQKQMAENEAIMTSRLNAINKTNIVVEYDLDGTIQTVNNLFCEITGYLDTEITGKHHRLLVDTEEKKSFKYKEFWNDLKKGNTQEGEFRRITKDGRYIFIQGVYSAMKDANGKAYKIMELAYDITDKKLQEAEINGQIQAISRTNIMLELDLDGIIQKANPMFCNLFEYTESEITGRHHRILVNKNDRQSADYNDIWISLRNGHFNEGEYTRLRNDGSEIYVKETMFPILDMTDKPYKIILLAFDISEIKLQQKQLAFQTQKLEESEKVLKTALDESQKREQEIKEKTERLASSEEELRQNLEEMQATQDEMERKQKELESMNQKIKASEQILKKTLSESKVKQNELDMQKEEVLATQEEIKFKNEQLLRKIEEKDKEIQKLKDAMKSKNK